jgi:hypothetical protein
MRELALQECQTVHGGGNYYCDDFLIFGATVALFTCAFINAQRRGYQKPEGTWRETLSCTAITALQFGAAGGLLDLISRYRSIT